MNKNWLYYISPCILASVICVIGIITGLAALQSSGGWSFIAVMIFGPALVILFVADILVKMLTKGNLLYIWIIEIIIVIITILWFKYKML
jgi:hypothetical protein